MLRLLSEKSEAAIDTAGTAAANRRERRIRENGRILVTVSTRRPRRPHGHDAASRTALAQRLAELLGFEFGGEYDAAVHYARALYFVPDEALDATVARALGIHDSSQLFGGVVPHPFVATKAITHPLLHPHACAPPGWSHAHAGRVQGAILRGFTAFSREDAQQAALTLLADVPVRIKCASGIGGSGQFVVQSLVDVREALAAIDGHEFAKSGVVVEENLDSPMTYSVGLVDTGQLSAAYCGTQQTTRNSHGGEVYGGSTLDVTRGGFAALREQEFDDDAREAIALASRYDEAALQSYDGLFASRRNYDVVIGTDVKRRRRAGVLEQSWRIGGASGAEILALEAFKRDPARTRMRSATREVYGAPCAVPTGAFVYFNGVDEHAGPLTKFAVEIHDAHAR